MTTLHKNDILKMKNYTFCIRTTQGNYIRVTKEALRLFFQQYKDKTMFTCDIREWSEGKMHFITIGE